ncbi:MAG TPA: phosphoribosylglycinamide formyltransferase [Chitinophagaceae bacterium]|jgi:formyltetrahydrofolate-dependent phosphoribosylglycinamide formyltransferase|nr:phosphoribosylglycinamide formyltransferase [Chitinophagaceae bacterium]
MLKRLQQKWKVGPVQIVIIIICFAIGGSLTGYLAKKIMNVILIEQGWLWVIIYILLVTIMWPLAVIIVSLFFGQFKFFSGYLHRIGIIMRLVKNVELNQPLNVNIAIFASGAGTNAQKIIDHFRNSSLAKIALIVCNKKKAGVLQIAEWEEIPYLLIEKQEFFFGNAYLDELKQKKIDFIVLAGFLWKIPEKLLKVYPKRIINIHPALLPNYGGQGMYGNFVHKAVLAAKEKESGITIHYVDEHYDNGDIILQVKCPILDGDTPESLANRIHALEHANYPVIIDELVRKLVSSH